jgi:hypothetical protein
MRRRWTSVSILLAAALAGGCSEEPDAARAESAPALSPALAVHDLVQAVSPLSTSAGPSEQNEWFARRKATLERLRQAGPEVGRAAWVRYREQPDEAVEVRIGLLDVAAHNVPEETREHLAELVTTFGPDLALRRAACELLAESAPRTAVEVLEPIVLRRSRKETYPTEDKMLAALCRAKRALGEDPSELLATVATDLHQSDDARHLAIRELAGTASPRGRAALDEILVESGMSSYLRRLAAQSLQKTLPEEEFCARANQVLEREADVNFQVFLASLIEASCR